MPIQLSLEELIEQYEIVKKNMSDAYDHFFANEISGETYGACVIAHDTFPLYIDGITDELCEQLYAHTGHWAI